MNDGLREILDPIVPAGVTVSVALAVPLRARGQINALACEATERLVTVKIAVVAPPATDTGVVTVAAAMLPLDRATPIPPEGAGPFRVTVPVELSDPPVTDVGLRDTDDTAGGLTVSVAVCVPLSVAEIVTGVVVPTAPEIRREVVEDDPGGTATLAGTVTAGLPLESVTVVPPSGAGPFSTSTVPVDEVPPVTVVGFRRN